MILLEAKSLSYSRDCCNILYQVSLSCSLGEKIAIYGPSGSGKSCLLALLCGAATPASGSISTCFELKDRSVIGYLPQDDFFLGHESILYNALLPSKFIHLKEEEALNNRVMEWLKFLDIPSNGDPYNLSGGEKRRLSLIRALALQPTILLADEWSSGLDHLNQAKVWSLIEECPSVICVTHDPNILSKCQKVYRMEQGRLFPS
ncbi:ABC transporter ATP-binding protein [Candidatus Similichlamydia laticola]|uniref:ABC transporter ATP-binding protein n=1 Tax=Candidatus Similichlamydia laticola TaxID=2170265 RepID=A0A369KAG4_9BACT|nr:ATP-binding cassette domain-containing protein [Candidatus Similichlamydia laticola]RDB31591.1 ABC transporter ATP-binding protein [Candidatus Similichlamydia laticola]